MRYVTVTNDCPLPVAYNNKANFSLASYTGTAHVSPLQDAPWRSSPIGIGCSHSTENSPWTHTTAFTAPSPTSDMSLLPTRHWLSKLMVRSEVSGWDNLLLPEGITTESQPWVGTSHRVAENKTVGTKQCVSKTSVTDKIVITVPSSWNNHYPWVGLFQYVSRHVQINIYVWPQRLKSR